MVMELLDPDIPEGNLTADFRAMLTTSCSEMWIGDPHAQPAQLMLTPGPITQSLMAVQYVDSHVVTDVPESALKTQQIRTVHVDLDRRRG